MYRRLVFSNCQVEKKILYDFINIITHLTTKENKTKHEVLVLLLFFQIHLTLLD